MARAVTYYVASTVTGEVIDELPLTGLSYGDAFSASAGFTATLPLRTLRRVTVDVGSPAVAATTKLALTGAAGSRASTTDHPSLDAPNELAIEVDLAAAGWSPAAAGMIVDRINAFAAADGGYRLSLNAAGTLTLTWSTGAAFVNRTSTANLAGLANLTRKRLRAKLVPNNGAGGHTVTFETSDDGIAWAALGAPIVTAGVTTIANGNFGLIIGADIFANNRLAADIYGVTVRDAGAPIVEVDFTDEVVGDPTVEAGALVFTVFAPAAIVEAAPAVEAVPPTYGLIPIDTRALLEPWANSIYVGLGDVLVYGGIVVLPKAALGKGTLEVAGKGLLSAYADGRRTVQSRAGMAHALGDLPSDVRWPAGTDLFEVVEDLFTHAETFAGDLGLERLYRGPGVGGLLGIGLEEDLAFATFERRGIYELLTSLAYGDPGFDFGLSYAWEDVDGNGRPKTTITFDPVRGRRTGLVLEAGKNITVLDYELNGEDQANALDGVGAGEGDSMVRTSVVDAELVYPAGRYPRLEGTYTNKRTTSAALLEAELRGALSRSVAPAEVVTVELVDTDDVPLGSFIAGDLVTLVAEDGFISLFGSWRIITYDVGFDTDGLPKITAKLTPETAYGDLFAGAGI